MNTRTCEIYKEGSWHNTSLNLVKKGELFRLFEPTGEAVLDDAGNSTWLANADGFTDGTGVYVVEIV